MGIPINNPVVSTLLQRAFGIQGRLRPQLEESIVPTVSLGDLSEGSEPPITRHVSVFGAIGLEVNERPIWRLEVPGNVIAVLTRLNFRAATAQDVLVHWGASLSAGAFPGTMTTTGYTDERLQSDQGGAQIPAAVVLTGTQVATIASEARIRINPPPDDKDFFPKGWVCGTGRPGQFGFIEFSASVIAQSFFIEMEWDEYQAS